MSNRAFGRDVWPFAFIVASGSMGKERERAPLRRFTGDRRMDDCGVIDKASRNLAREFSSRLHEVESSTCHVIQAGLEEIVAVQCRKRAHILSLPFYY